MVELEVQKYLRSGKSLDDLKAELGIDYNVYGSLVILNYSQIDSPKTHPIVMECRGIVLEQGTFNICSYALSRFFNDGESTEVVGEFDYSRAVGLQKLDGTLVSVFNYKDKWYMATRGVIENSCNVGMCSITFRELFYQTSNKYPNFWSGLDKGFCYCFELTATENRVVTLYFQRELHLLTMRDVDTWKELPLEALQAQSKAIGVDLPGIVSFSGKEGLMSLIRGLATLEEGFVSVIYEYGPDGLSFRRVKVKNPSYVAIHHMKDRAGRSLRSLVTLVLDKNIDETLIYFPEFKPFTDKVQAEYDAYVDKLAKDQESVKGLLGLEITKESKKAYAEKVKSYTNTSFMFELYSGHAGSVKEFFSNMEKRNGRPFLEKYLVDRLGLKDIKIYEGTE